MQVEPITYVMNCEKTSCVNSHHPIVLQIEREIIETFDNMLDDLELNNHFFELVPFNHPNPTHIQYLNTYGDVNVVELKFDSMQDTLKELRIPVVVYRPMIKTMIEEVFLDDEIYATYRYPHLDRLQFYQYHKV